MLDKPAFAGQSYRQMVAFLIKQAEQYASPEIIAALKTKMVTALHLAQAKAMSLGKTADAGKLADAINKIYGEAPEIAQAGFEAYKNGGGTTIGSPKAAQPTAPKPVEAAKPAAAPPTQAKKSDLEKYTPKFAEALKAIAEQYKVSSKKSVRAKLKAAVQNDATVEAFELSLKPAEKKKLEKMWGPAAVKVGKTAAQAAYESYQKYYGAGGYYATSSPPPPPPVTPPTEAELTKAKKSAALQMEYVPSAPTTATGQAEAQKLIDAFNAQYADKELTDPAALMTKVNDFKAMAAKVAQITAKEQPALAQQNAEHQKKMAEQKQAAAKALKEAQEAAKAKNKQYMADLGISETEATGFDALVEMVGGSSADVATQFKKYQNEAQSHGYPITGFQYALIRNYIDGGYSSINKALRSESWSAKQHVYARLVNNAIDKMPKYTGWVERGTQLDADEIAKYKPGYVVPQKAFTSTGIGYKFGGNVTTRSRPTASAAATSRLAPTRARRRSCSRRARTSWSTRSSTKAARPTSRWKKWRASDDPARRETRQLRGRQAERHRSTGRRNRGRRRAAGGAASAVGQAARRARRADLRDRAVRERVHRSEPGQSFGP